MGAGVEVLDAGPADFDAGPGVLDTGPPAGGRDDFLFSPGFAGEGEGAEATVAAAAGTKKIKQKLCSALFDIILGIMPCWLMQS